ncbi:hypothetical protein MHTCC0001_17240 [Flavobacteriaceae bacterium MHTCC 0001]
MNINPTHKRIISKIDVQPIFQLTPFKFVKIGLVILSLLITACNREEDDGIVENCPEVSLTIQEDTNDKANVTVQATSSIIQGATYTWKVVDQEGTHNEDGNTDGSLTWHLKDGETKFCATINTLDCTEGVEACIAHDYKSMGDIQCEDKRFSVISEANIFYRDFVFKDEYIYYAQSKIIGFGTEAGVTIYKLNLSDENAVPIKVIDVNDNINGWVADIEFKDDILYVSVYNSIFFSKVYKIDTSATNPSLVEVLDGYLMRSMAVNGNDMYMANISKFQHKISKIDINASTPMLTEFVTTNSGALVKIEFKDDELYIAKLHGNGSSISKIDLSDPNLKETIIYENTKDSFINDMTLKGNDLYILFYTDHDNKNWIGKLNIVEASAAIEKVGEKYSFKALNFGFYKGWLYMAGEDNSKGVEIFKIPACSL